MKSGNRGGMVRKAVLPKLASFFRQLSLFDKWDEPSEPAPAVPKRVVTSAIPVASSESFSGLCRGPYAHIEVLIKPRMWENWRVFWTRRNESLRLEIPALLESAPAEVKVGLLKWAVLVSRRGVKKDKALRAERSGLETLIREYLRSPSENAGPSPNRARIQARLQARNNRRLQRMSPKGLHNDLTLSFERVNARYFSGTLQAVVTWSARLGGLSTHSMAQDGEGRPYHLISISRGYDNAEVTPEILDGVMYHECLHAAIPPVTRNGRRIVHGPEFRRREREYEHFEVWRKWHRDGLPKALIRMARSGR
jgi:hypothetical protein